MEFNDIKRSRDDTENFSTKEIVTRGSRAGKIIRLNEKNAKIIVDAVAEGNYIETAAQLVGLHPKMVMRYLKNGFIEYEKQMSLLENGIIEEKDLKLTIQGHFYLAVTKARARAQADGINVINKAGKEGAWQAIAWRLERVFPKQFGKKTETKVEGEVKHTIRTVAPKLARVGSEAEFVELANEDNISLDGIHAKQLVESTKDKLLESSETDSDDLDIDMNEFEMMFS